MGSRKRKAEEEIVEETDIFVDFSSWEGWILRLG